jgi:hypothetical protein
MRELDIFAACCALLLTPMCPMLPSYLSVCLQLVSVASYYVGMPGGTFIVVLFPLLSPSSFLYLPRSAYHPTPGTCMLYRSSIPRHLVAKRRRLLGLSHRKAWLHSLPEVRLCCRWGICLLLIYFFLAGLSHKCRMQLTLIAREHLRA